MPQEARKNYAIIGASFAGNKGAEAMLTTTIAEIRKREPDSIVHVLSYLPDEDRRLPRPENTYIHSATPAAIVFFWQIPALFAHFIPSLRKPCSHNDGAGILSLLKVDAVFDIFGVSFMDNRLKFIPFNLLTLLPFLLHKRTVFKLSQAMGPFRNVLNRVSARWVAGQLAFIAARGFKTLEMLEGIGLSQVGGKLIESSDIAFLLPRADEKERTARHTTGSVAMIPSRVVAQKLPDYVDRLVEIGMRIHAAGWQTSIIVHSWRDKPSQQRNNDIAIAEAVVGGLAASGVDSKLLGIGLNAAQIRREIGSCDVVLTSRFHGMIAALAEARPVVVVGWSHKYEEVLTSFDLQDYAVPYDAFNVDAVFHKLEACASRADSISEAIQNRLPEVNRSARIQFETAFEHLRNRNE